MNWATVILALLNLANSLTGWLRDRQMLTAGQDKAVAQASLTILEATRHGKLLHDKIVAMDDPAAEELWRRMLEQ